MVSRCTDSSFVIRRSRLTSPGPLDPPILKKYGNLLVRAERSGKSCPTLFRLRANRFYERRIHRHARLPGAGTRNQTRHPARGGIERAVVGFQEKREHLARSA